MKKLLKPGGYILHSTYWLHDIWNPENGLPSNPMLRNPWHISICSEKTMQIIAAKTGLEFIKCMKVKTDTRQAYLLKKPGGTNPPFFIQVLNKLHSLKRIAAM